uniref:HMG box domain-containing protein n=1 Tax=Seriola dumerili TaxID=41447 RepID=A0A3B4TFA8_SERDU
MTVKRMDLRAAFEHVVAGMEWEDVIDTFQTVPVQRGCGECILQGAAPGPDVGQAAPTIYQDPLNQQNAMQPGHLYSQTGAYSQGQNDRLPQGMMESLVPVGVVNGELLYGIPAERLLPTVSTAPPSNTPVSQKRKRESQQGDGWPYVKKPPNAFMLFRKEQRPNVVTELNISDSAAVNTVLGQRWRALSKEEQAKYYEQAIKEKQLHTEQFPQWSCSTNYGKKRKRIRRKAPTTAEASASRLEEVTEQVMTLCLTPVEPAVMEPSTTQTAQKEAPHTQAVVMEDPVLVTEAPHRPTGHSVSVTLPYMEAPVTVPVCDIDELLRMYDACMSSALYCKESTHPASYGKEDTLMMAQHEQTLPSLRSFSCSPLHFFYLD